MELSDFSVDLTKPRKRVLIQVTGMSCASCVAKIERHLGKKRGEEGLIVSVPDQQVCGDSKDCECHRKKISVLGNILVF